MNKTISITLSGLLFHVEEKAYERLQAYLKSIQKHFASHPDREEILADIERSVAEQFTAQLSPSKNVISEKEVEELIKQMGSIEDFQAFEQEEKHSEPERVPKKLFRNPEDKVIAGVASGLAAYFGIDPTIMRLVLFLSIFINGLGILLYLVLWAIVPEAKTTAEKMEMQGKPVNLGTIAENMKEELDKSIKKIPQGSWKKFFDGLGEIVKKLTWLVIRVLGLMLILLPGMALVALIVPVMGGILFLDIAYHDVPLTELVAGTDIPILMAIIYVFVLIPILVLALVGVSLLRGKNVISPALAAGLISVWVLALVGGFFLNLNNTTSLPARVQQIGAPYQKSSKVFEASDFSKLQLHSGYTYKLKKGDAYRVEAKAGLKTIENMDIRKIGGETLRISAKSRAFICILCDKPELEITLPSLELIEVFNEDQVNVLIEGFEESNLKFVITNAEVQANLAVENLQVDLRGRTYLKLMGRAQELSSDLSGGSTLHASLFPIQKALLEQRDRSSSRINAREISVQLWDRSRLLYEGDPEFSLKEIAPAATIINLNDENF